jgi:hypothetical protein
MNQNGCANTQPWPILKLDKPEGSEEVHKNSWL